MARGRGEGDRPRSSVGDSWDGRVISADGRRAVSTDGRLGESTGGLRATSTDGRRWMSIEGRRAVGEGLARLRGRWEVELDDKPRCVGVTTRVVRGVGERVRMGLDPRGLLEPVSELLSGRWPELAAAFLEEVRAGWLLDFDLGVGLSGGLGRSRFLRVGVEHSGEGDNGGDSDEVGRSSSVLGVEGVEAEGCKTKGVGLVVLRRDGN